MSAATFDVRLSRTLGGRLVAASHWREGCRLPLPRSPEHIAGRPLRPQLASWAKAMYVDVLPAQERGTEIWPTWAEGPAETAKVGARGRRLLIDAAGVPPTQDHQAAGIRGGLPRRRQADGG